MATYPSTLTNVWYDWVGNGTASTALTWQQWVPQTWSATASTSTTQIWLTWAGNTNTTVYTGGAVATPLPVETDEQKAEREARERIWAEERAARRAARVAAEERARAILEESLDEAQRATYRAGRRFRVLSADGERIYEIGCEGQHGNVRRVDREGRTVARYCIQPVGGLPDADAQLAQKLWLEADEESFLRVANAS